MKKVLITGANGFTGRYIRKELIEAGYKVFGLVEKNAAFDDISCNLLDEFNLIEQIGLRQPDYVIHLAAVSYPAHKNSLDFYKVNVLGTLNLLKALHAAKINLKKILIASSANVYGPPQGPHKIDELRLLSPRNHYAASKLAMEYLTNTWANRLPITITRPFNYTGKGQPENFLVPKIVHHFKRIERVIYLGNLDVVREYNDVRMVARAYVTLLENDVVQSPINICTGQGYSLIKILETCRHLTGHNIKVKVDPELIRPDETPVLVGNPDLFNHFVPNLPQYSLRETLQWMLEDEQFDHENRTGDN